MEGASGALRGTRAAMDGASGALRGTRAAMEGASGALRGTRAAMGGASGALRGTRATMDGASGALRGTRAAMEGASGALRGTRAAMEGASGALRGTRAAMGGLSGPVLVALAGGHVPKALATAALCRRRRAVAAPSVTVRAVALGAAELRRGRAGRAVGACVVAREDAAAAVRERGVADVELLARVRPAQALDGAWCRERLP